MTITTWVIFPLAERKLGLGQVASGPRKVAKTKDFEQGEKPSEMRAVKAKDEFISRNSQKFSVSIFPF